MAYVKMETEANEFEVYLDIDGAVEEDEDSATGGPDVQSVPLTEGEAAVRLPWPLDRGDVESAHRSKTRTSHLETSASVRSARYLDSDNEEIDIDTPYDGRLMGQTQVKTEPAVHPNLLNRLLGYVSVPDPHPSGAQNNAISQKKANLAKKSSVAKKSTTQKKPATLSVAWKSSTFQTSKNISKNVAVKSTTPARPSIQQVPKFNVAKKSTSKPSKPVTKSAGLKTWAAQTKTSNLLQVKFGPGKPATKSQPVHSRKTSASGFSTKVLSKNKQSAVAPSSSSKFGSLISSQFVSSNKMFMYNEKSGDKMTCPECSVVIAQWCLRAHMKTMHNLTLKFCKKCRVTFSDMNLFSEHYALHLQEEEELSSGVYSSPAGVNRSAECPRPAPAPLQLPAKPKEPVAKKLHSPVSVSGFPRGAVGAYSAAGTSYGTGGHPKLGHPQKTPPPKKRKLFPAGGVESPKFSRLSKEIASLSREMTFPLQPRLPPKPRKPGNLFKKRRLSPASVSTVSLSPRSLRSEGSAERRNSWTSLPSDMSDDSSSDTSDHTLAKLPRKSQEPYIPKKSLTSYNPKLKELRRPASVHYMKSQKAALRRGPSAVYQGPADLLPSKKMGWSEASSARGAEVCQKKAVVSLVSLETASQPYDCKTCLAAFHLALACPQSFRQTTQRKSFTSSSYSATFSQLHQLKTHSCRIADKKYESGMLDESMKKPTNSSAPLHDDTPTLPTKSEKRPGVFECSFCKEEFQYRSYYLRHLPYHAFQYCCGVCKKAFDEKVDLLDHLQIMHDGRLSLRCKYCEKRFEDMKEFEIHMHSHKGGTVVPCNVCNKKFKNSRQMHMHSKVVHGISQGTFVRMRPSYGYVKPIVTKFLSCRECGKVFHKKQGLSSHYRLCHGMSVSAALTTLNKKSSATTAQTPEDPPVQIQPKPALPALDEGSKQQVAGATAGSNGRCHICGAMFVRRKKLVMHLRRQHGLEMSGETSTALKCKLCGKFVYTLQGLKTHYRLRHKKSVPKPFTATDLPVCGRCNRVFSDQSTLLWHEQLFHSKSLDKPVPVKENPAGTSQPRQDKTTTSGQTKFGSTKMGSNWLCQVCQKPFGRFKSLRMHIKAEHPESFVDQRCGTRKCTKCKKSFGSKALLLAHVKLCRLRQGVYRQRTNRHFPGAISCTLCPRKFHWKQNLVRHMQVNHNVSKEEMAYNMTHVKLATAQQKQLKPAKHRLYLCRVCNICFPKKLSYSRHIQRTHGGRSDFFQCRIRRCQKTFSCTKALVKHIKSFHPEISPFRCHGCQTGFRSVRVLFGHSCGSSENAEAFSSAQQGEDDVYKQDSTSALSHQECRYRCTACGLGFHIAREWTKHMQGHAECVEERGLSDPDAADNVQVNVFDVMSAGSMYKCHLCNKVFADGHALALHACEQFPQKMTATTVSKGEVKNKLKSKYEPVMCTICLKMFSPLSIKRHMMNIHSLPMRVCKICNIVFTDIERFRRHREGHKQQETAMEGDAGAASGDDDILDDSVTFFICQTCGGLFSGADSLAQHECSVELASEPALADDDTFMDDPSTHGSQAEPAVADDDTFMDDLSTHGSQAEPALADDDTFMDDLSTHGSQAEPALADGDTFMDDPSTTHGSQAEPALADDDTFMDHPSTHGSQAEPAMADDDTIMDDPSTHRSQVEPGHTDCDTFMDDPSTHRSQAEPGQADGDTFMDHPSTHGSQAQPGQAGGDTFMDDPSTHGSQVACSESLPAFACYEASALKCSDQPVENLSHVSNGNVKPQSLTYTTTEETSSAHSMEAKANGSEVIATADVQKNVGTDHAQTDPVPSDIQTMGTDHAQTDPVPSDIQTVGTDHAQTDPVPSDIQTVGTDHAQTDPVPSDIQTVGTDHAQTDPVPLDIQTVGTDHAQTDPVPLDIQTMGTDHAQTDPVPSDIQTVGTDHVQTDPVPSDPAVVRDMNKDSTEETLLEDNYPLVIGPFSEPLQTKSLVDLEPLLDDHDFTDSHHFTDDIPADSDAALEAPRLCGVSLLPQAEVIDTDPDQGLASLESDMENQLTSSGENNERRVVRPEAGSFSVAVPGRVQTSADETKGHLSSVAEQDEQIGIPDLDDQQIGTAQSGGVEEELVCATKDDPFSTKPEENQMNSSLKGDQIKCAKDILNTFELDDLTSVSKEVLDPALMQDRQMTHAQPDNRLGDVAKDVLMNIPQPEDKLIYIPEEEGDQVHGAEMKDNQEHFPPTEDDLLGPAVPEDDQTVTAGVEDDLVDTFEVDAEHDNMVVVEQENQLIKTVVENCNQLIDSKGEIASVAEDSKDVTGPSDEQMGDKFPAEQAQQTSSISGTDAGGIKAAEPEVDLVTNSVA